MWLNPLTLKKLKRFRAIKRGYYSFVILASMVFLSLFAELFINSRALVVKYNDKFYFPTFGAIIPGTEFGLDYEYETRYRLLKEKFKEEGGKNWLIMPLVPYNAYESISREGIYPPYPPSFEFKNYFGTDTSGRDILARLVYGFRIAIWFSIVLTTLTYVVGIAIGCMMGYWAGTFDIVMQRIIEIWSNVPFLYVIMIISSVLVPNFGMLLAIMVFFGWHGMTFYMRASTYREKSREYVLAAQSLGASPVRIIFRHILPNSISIIVTFVPFAIASGITSLTALDYLGFGLPPPTPSWGELLEQGTSNMQAVWIVSSVVSMMVVVLTMVTFIGEAIREAFDPKKFSIYQ